MSPNILFPQNPRETLAGPTREVVNAPTLLSTCCACGRVQEEEAPLGRQRWVTQRTYRKIHGVSPAELKLTHTYCPKCFAQVQESVRQFFREAG